MRQGKETIKQIEANIKRLTRRADKIANTIHQLNRAHTATQGLISDQYIKLQRIQDAAKDHPRRGKQKNKQF